VFRIDGRAVIKHEVEIKKLKEEMEGLGDG
jgi:hypothetical protein